MKRLVPGLVIGALIVSASAVAAQDGGTLAAVQERGTLVCGVNGGLPGMSVLNEETNRFEGMDADYCRAVAVAVLGDADAVEYRPLTADQRAAAVQGGEVDVLFRNTTNRFDRDASWGDFGPTIFYDGQGVMAREDLGITTLEGLDGATICVTSGTTTEQNLSDTFGFLGIAYEPVVAAEIDTVYGAYEEGRCDAVTSDRSQLSGRRSVLANPDEHIIFGTVFTKEPLAPLTAHGDHQWTDIVAWTVNATILAEELGVTSENIGDHADSAHPEISRLLGQTGELASTHLGLSDTFAADVIATVGNYGEIYDRGFGPDTAQNVERGLNALWTNGGLIFAPPYK